ncbi:restriction endonuclease subunit S [Bifidobacterium apri]|uniref:Type I restriction-modification system,specificity subunit S n=2 Tax=Bifidobacterium apri TaxID=1769423 RepID=A0A6A2WGL6_9BIFI|nr:restriction endonuclease subunit S [Bifidobacterium apri]KAB8301852.1 Type I restriction-modification system,specificity subunit S [Bifidobacterium apri]
MAKKNSKKTVPDLRFRGFTDPWEQRQLGESFNMLRNNTLSRADLSNDRKGVLDIHYGDVLIRYRAVVDVSTLQGPSINITNNRFLGDRLTDGDIIMADTAEDTSAGKCVEIEGIMHQNVVAGLHTIPLRPATPSSHGYWGQYLNSASFRNQLFPKMQGTKVISLSRTTVSNATVRYPSLAEQRRIGEFFSTLDSLIAAAERQETLLRRKKQAYLQLMFPREGETQPRLRFAGFSGGWERRQLREVAEKTGSGGTPTSSNPRYYGGSIPFLGISDINGRYVDTTQKTLTEEGLANSAAWIVPQGTISLAMYASYGKSAILARAMATSQAFFNIVFRSNVTRDFVFSRLQCAESRHEWDALVSTGTQPNLSGSKLKKWTIGYPSLPEQHHIGEFFKVLDSLIAAAEERTKALTALKSVYLQRMFA